jgi:hypothetical protein
MQVQVFIELNSAVKVPRNAQRRVTHKQVALPGSVRRRLLAVEHAPPICINLPLDPSCRYEVGQKCIDMCLLLLLLLLLLLWPVSMRHPSASTCLLTPAAAMR